MNVKPLLFLPVLAISLAGCNTKPTQIQTQVVGTWALVSATATEAGKTVSTFDPTHKMIKIINATHFAFLNHAVAVKPDSSHAFTGGGGHYTLVDSVYTEELTYFTDKAWEGNKFKFVVSMAGDTLIQKGVEKVEKLGIDRVIIEKYKRVDQSDSEE